jgi:glycolate oxidase iron-sulfur subunit
MNVAAFAAYPDAIVAVNSAGCAAMLKEYGRLLTGDPLESEAVALSGRVQDVCELLAEAGPREGAKIRLRVAYDPPCHLLHAQGIQEAPLRILNSVPGLECVQPRAAELCCGSAGTYSLTETVLSRAVLTQKTAALREVEPDLVASGNPGCIMQIGAGLAVHGSELRVVHPVEILDWSYQEAGVYDL